MIVSEEEKERLDQMLRDFKTVDNINYKYSNTLIEVVRFMDETVRELKDTNPELAKKMIDKFTIIMKRGILNEY